MNNMTFYNLMKIAQYRGIEKTALRNIFRKALMFPGHSDPKMAKMTVGQYQKAMQRQANSAFGNDKVSIMNKNRIANQQAPEFAKHEDMKKLLDERLNQLGTQKSVKGPQNVGIKQSMSADDYSNVIAHRAEEMAKQKGTYVNPISGDSSSYGKQKIETAQTNKMLKDKGMFIHGEDPNLVRANYSKMTPNAQQRRDYDAQLGQRAQEARRAKFDQMKADKEAAEAAAAKLEASKPVTPTPVTPTPSTPVTPTPSTPTSYIPPIAPTPAAPTPATPTPVAPAVGSGSNLLRNSAIAAGGLGLGYGAARYLNRDKNNS